MDDGDTTFHANEYSWNKFANVLYIESPGGVGFSTCGSNLDCTFNDDESADDNAIAIQYFFDTLFPEYLGNPLFISGESYAGIYVPYLLDRLDALKQSGTLNTNLQGMIVGNGATNWHYDTTPAFVEMGYWHGLYDDALYETITKNGCEAQYSRFAEAITPECFEALLRFEALVADINVYDVYGECYMEDTLLGAEMYEGSAVADDGVDKKKKTVGITMEDYTPWLFRTQAEGQKKRLMNLPKCTFG